MAASVRSTQAASATVAAGAPAAVRRFPRESPTCTSAAAPARLSMTQVLLCGAAIVTLSMGIRHGFGLWLQPITMDRGWTRETFAFALAIQNLAWGMAGPFAGMLADRFGAFRVLAASARALRAGPGG